MRTPFRCAFSAAVVPAAAAACDSSLLPVQWPALVLGKGDGDGTSREALDDVPTMRAWQKNVHRQVCVCVCGWVGMAAVLARENIEFCSLCVSSSKIKIKHVHALAG